MRSATYTAFTSHRTRFKAPRRINEILKSASSSSRPPRGVSAFRCWRNLQGFEDPADRGCADPVAGLEQLALNPLVPVPLENRILALTWIFPVFRRLARTR